MKSALQLLLADLAEIKKEDRSPYEEAVYQELSELAKKSMLPKRRDWWSHVNMSMPEDIKRLRCSYPKCPNQKI
jgi:hypothetical protein